VIVEAGSDLVAELWDARLDVASSILSYPEAHAALAAARRGGPLGAIAHRQAREDFEAVYGELLVIGVDAQLAGRAGQLAEQLGLRGYDAVHLASALALAADVTFVSWDVQLRRAAAASGCAVAPGG
jgi:predicted nucleic acid-binding protein